MSVIAGRPANIISEASSINESFFFAYIIYYSEILTLPKFIAAIARACSELYSVVF